MNLARLHRAREAEAQFRQAVRLDPRSHTPNHNLGEFYVQAGKLAEAIPYLRRAQEIDAGDYNNGFDLALAYQQTGNLEAARRVLQELMKLRDTAELHSVLAEVEERSHHYIAAAQQYERAARMEASESNIFDLGAEMLIHQTFEPAIAVFQSGVARYPQSARLALGLGVALYGSGHYDESAQQFLRVAERNPADPLPLVFLGRAYDNLSAAVAGQVRARLKGGIQSFPRNAALRYFYAMALWKLHQENSDAAPVAEIEALLKSAVALASQLGEAHLQLGVVYAAEQKYTDAIAEYQQALNHSARTAAIHYRLGQALARSGKTAQAQQEFAAFERLRAQETSASNQQNAEIQQFVYTMKQAPQP
jgi:tetratricopeptide (TPR) repeat protein